MTKLDVLIWGASSSTGKVVTAYIQKNYGADAAVRWGIGGRNRERLAAVRVAAGAPESLPIFVGNSSDASFLDTLAQQAKVIVTTVGPYMRYGRELVAACARHGTDYCDLTGEVLFMRAMIDEHHQRARATGARIVHACGFDSVPSDIGVLLLQEAAKAAHSSPCVTAKLFVMKMRGGFGGGTAATMIDQGARLKDPEVRKIVADPYALDPSRRGREREAPEVAYFDRDIEQWVGPFVMAAVNTRVVQRSNALLGYGRDFRYREGVAFGTGARGRILATLDAAGLQLATQALAMAPTRKLIEKLVPPPGQGPSAAVMQGGYFKLKLIGQTQSGLAVAADVAGTSDPGHGETAKMLVESALCLAADERRALSQGGVLTPASAMGLALAERLRAAGMTFETSPSPRMM